MSFELRRAAVAGLAVSHGDPPPLVQERKSTRLKFFLLLQDSRT